MHGCEVAQATSRYIEFLGSPKGFMLNVGGTHTIGRGCSESGKGTKRDARRELRLWAHCNLVVAERVGCALCNCVCPGAPAHPAFMPFVPPQRACASRPNAKPSLQYVVRLQTIGGRGGSNRGRRRCRTRSSRASTESDTQDSLCC